MKVKKVEIYKATKEGISLEREITLKGIEYFDINRDENTLNIIIDKKNRFNFRDLYYDLKNEKVNLRNITKIEITNFGPLYHFMPSKENEILELKNYQEFDIWLDKRDFTLYILIEEE